MDTLGSNTTDKVYMSLDDQFSRQTQIGLSSSFCVLHADLINLNLKSRSLTLKNAEQMCDLVFHVFKYSIPIRIQSFICKTCQFLACMNLKKSNTNFAVIWLLLCRSVRITWKIVQYDFA